MSFDYHDKARNILVGRKDLHKCPKGARALSRDIHAQNGKVFVRGVDINDGHKIKQFNVDEISNLQGV